MSRLRAALDPKSVAVIGASENPNKVGGRPVHYLGKFGFKGKTVSQVRESLKITISNATNGAMITNGTAVASAPVAA